jgi:hypothetical protein
MDNNKLKTFAQQTRLKLINLVRAKLQLVLTTDSAMLRGREKDVALLRDDVKKKGEDQLIEEVAYTWFNRVMALRFMDANGYNMPMVVTPAEGESRPEILSEALAGKVDEKLNIPHQEINDLLQGKTSDSHPQETLYRKLFIAQCNALGCIMPFLFEKIQDYTELLLPDNLLSDQSFITDIRNGMSDEDCHLVQIIGWLYQFYITDRKAEAEVNKSREDGLRSDEQAAATQLFTPDWIVCYMVENTLGRIWLTLHPDSPLRKQMKYYIEPVDGKVDPIPEHIKSVKDITLIDPCMGSGHVLVYAFFLFAQMYEEEGYMKKDIPALIFENNLFGLDIDKRCYQLASFALTMAACQYAGRYYLRHTVLPRVMALLPIEHDVIESAGSWTQDSVMWWFEYIDTVGSLLEVTPKEYETIHYSHDDIFGEKTKLMKEEAWFLSQKYDCVVTNPPYLGKGLGAALDNYITAVFPDTRIDMMASFMERAYSFLTPFGMYSMINQTSWMFKKFYSEFRSNLISLKYGSIRNLLYLGPGTFEEINGERVQSVAFVSSNSFDSTLCCYYLKNYKSSKSKEYAFVSHKANCYVKDISSFTQFDDNQFGFWIKDSVLKRIGKTTLLEVGDAKQGIKTGDNSRFIHLWHEINHDKLNCKWFPVEVGGYFRKWYGNHDSVLNWENNGFEIKNFKKPNGKLRSRPQNISWFFKRGITWSTSAGDKPSFRFSDDQMTFESSGSKFFLKNNDPISFYAGYLNSPVAKMFIEVFAPGIGISEGAIKGLPFIDEKFPEITSITEECIILSKQDWDSHETSWDFQVNPLVAITNGNILSSYDYEKFKSFGFRYNDEQRSSYNQGNGGQQNTLSLADCVKSFERNWKKKFDHLHHNEEEINRQFINIYDLQDELTPDVPLSEITILQQGEISIRNENQIVWHEDVLMKQLISYLIGCSMGRYAVDKPGLILANQGDTIDDFLKQVPNPTVDVDDDGIIPVLDGDYFQDDATERIKNALKAVFGKDNYQENLSYLEQKLDMDIRCYLTKDFYKDHCQMYQKRPIYWMFASSKGTFKALVYMHRMTPDTLSRLLANYVQPFIGARASRDVTPLLI